MIAAWLAHSGKAQLSSKHCSGCWAQWRCNDTQQWLSTSPIMAPMQPIWFNDLMMIQIVQSADYSEINQNLQNIETNWTIKHGNHVSYSHYNRIYYKFWLYTISWSSKFSRGTKVSLYMSQNLGPMTISRDFNVETFDSVRDDDLALKHSEH